MILKAIRPILQLTAQSPLTTTALLTPTGVKSAASRAADIHVVCEPMSDERAGAENYYQHTGVQEKLLQAL
jgi:hypothetical protein